MSYGGDNYGHHRGGSRRGRRGRGRGGNFHNQRMQREAPRGDPAIVTAERKAPKKKKKEITTKDKVKEQLAKMEIEESRKYSKFELLEIFSSVDKEKAERIMTNFEGLDIILDHSQNPCLLEEAENELTLEDLRPNKRFRGRAEFAQEKAPDDYNDDEDPEWLEFKPKEKKFDFTKVEPLKKMFDNTEGVDMGALEDEDDSAEETTEEPKPLSMEELERQQFSKTEGSSPPFTQPEAAQPELQPFGGFSQPPTAQQPPMNQGFPGEMPMGQPNMPTGGGFAPPNMGQPNSGHPPMGANQFEQNPGSFGAPQQNQEFGGPFGQMYQPPSDGGFGGFPGFGESDPFGGFGQSFQNPMEGFGDPFSQGLFGAPQPTKDEEFAKMFQQPGQPQQPGGFYPQQPSQDPNQQPGMFGFGPESDNFMATNDEEDEEDDWLMEDQFSGKHLDFIDGQGNTPTKEKLDLIKATETIEVSYKYVKTEKKRIPKPRKVHTFKPRIREKKRFEKIFDVVEPEEPEAPQKKPHQQDVNMALVKKFWDMKRDPTDLEMLNLIQNPFSFHLVNKRLPPQFFLNKDGPIFIGELFMWFNQGLVPKTFQVGHDANCYKYNSRQCFLFEKFFNEHLNQNLSHEEAPEEIITVETKNEVSDLEPEVEETIEKEEPKASPQLVDPAIATVIQDEAITVIDAAQIEKDLAKDNEYAWKGNPEGMGYMGQPPPQPNQPFDPAIVSFQNHNPEEF